MSVKNILLGTCVAGVVLEIGAATPSAQSAKPSTRTRTRETAEQVYKNIQVLKGVPADQLIPAMQFIAASLGVQCDFCHLENAFEKDDKETKQTARKMMEMMFAINKDNFDGHREVTCNSCHRGSTDPMAIPAVMTEEPKMAMVEPKKPETEADKGATEAKENSGPAADQLFDKYVQAS